MSEEKIEVQEVQVDYKTLAEKLQKDLTKVEEHNKTLFEEKKKTQRERDEAKQAHAEAAKEQLVKQGDYKDLYEKEIEVRKQREKDLEDYRAGIKDEKIKFNALKLASELTARPENAELLAHFVQMKIAGLADEHGHLPDDVVTSIKREFSADKKYASLVAGTKSSGGGALGSGDSVANTKVLTRAEWSTLGETAKGKFFTSGGQLTD